MKRVVVATALLGVSSVSADELSSAREQGLYEVSHAVEIRVADGVATYKVRRQFANPGKVSDEARLAIDLPSGAAATGLRIRAKDRWYDGLLMEAGKAAALYQELTGMGAFDPKDPALLSWRWTDKLMLQVFPVMPKQVSTVEYTLTVPTRYANGRYFISYPRIAAGAAKLATPTITVKPAYGDALTAITIDDRRVAPDTPIVLAVPPKQPWEDVVAKVESASYAASTLEVPASSHTTKPIASVTLDLGITHTYLGDLQVELITPQNKRVVVREQAGAGENDLAGTQVVTLPPGTIPAGTWRLVVSDHIAADAGSIDRWKLSFGTGADATAVSATDVPVFVPDAPESPGDAGVATIAIAPPPIATWTARFGRIVASPANTIGRLEIDVAPQLSKLPAKAQIVFVVDASYSGGETFIATQLATIRAYLSHVPDAEVEIVVYRRRATRVFGAFVPANQLDDRLKSVPSAFVLGNGSALDDGARLATTLLADRPGPRRAVLMTDERLRRTLVPADGLAALAKLSADTVVHVVVPHATIDSDDRVVVEREDDHAFAPLATKHHGIFAHVRGVAAAKQLAPSVLELVRPTRIERVRVAGFTLVDSEPTLLEGSGLRIWAKQAAVPANVVVDGVLWSDPIKKSLAPTAEFSRATAAFAFGADQHEGLTPDEMMTVALAGRAVSPVTSYVAFEPGTRPSRDGLDDMDVYGGLLGNSVGEGGFGFGMGSSITKPWIAVPTERCVARHQPAPGWRVDLAIETTRDEIVDVSVSLGGGAFAACLVEAAWAVRLDDVFREDHDQLIVTLKDG